MSMKGSLKSGLAGFAVGLALAAATAQAATQHEHPTAPAQQPAVPAMRNMEGMADMHAMMSDPAMREKMMANMAQCRDMMSMMMEHMKHEGMKDMPAPHK
jgi:hypothetical protein